MHHTLLSNLSIAELAELVDGRLRLGCLPPLGGALEPVGRILTDCQQVAPGDVFWGLTTAAGNGSREAELAYARQAAGAVVERRGLEPWAGKFSIEVPDTQLALWQLATHIRQRFGGPVIGLLGNRLPSRLDAWLPALTGLTAQVCGVPTSEGPTSEGPTSEGPPSECPASECQPSEGPAKEGRRSGEPSMRLALGLLELHEASEAAVVVMPVTCFEEIDVFSHLCDPEIVVINAQHLSTLWPVGQPHDKEAVLEQLLKSLPPRTWTIVLGPMVDTGSRRTPAPVRTGSSSSECCGEPIGSQVRRDGELHFQLDSAELELRGANQDEREAAVIAGSLARILGGNHQLTGNPSRIAEASPFAFGLRESDAALPPGLKRLAY